MYRLNASGKKFDDEFESKNLELSYKYNIISFINISPKLLLAYLDYL